MTTKNAPKRAKGQSKKNKSQWRKTDIKDVEDFLEDKRLEERLGGKFDDREDKDLFIVDGKPDETQATKRGERKKNAREAKLNCYRNLEITGGAPDPKKGGRFPRRNPEVHRDAREEKLRKKGIIKAKVKIAQKHRSMATEKKKATKLERSTRRRTKFDFDLWEDDGGNEDVKNMKENEWLENGTKLVNLRGTRSHKPKIPQRESTTELDAVEEPHGGESYNPSLKDHQDLVWKAAMVEMNKEREKKKIEYHTTRLFPSEALSEEAKLKEMSEGIHELDEDEEEVSEVEDEGEEKKAVKPKTRKQRRKELEKKKDEAKTDRLKKEKLKNQDILRVKSLKKEIKSEEDLMKINMAKKAAKKAAKKRSAAQLSSVKYEDKDIDLKLSHELTGNLRSLKPEGNLLEDRFKSLQKRNVIETRVKQKVVKNRRNRRRVEKRSHKMGFSWEKS